MDGVYVRVRSLNHLLPSLDLGVARDLGWEGRHHSAGMAHPCLVACCRRLVSNNAVLGLLYIGCHTSQTRVGDVVIPS